MDSKSLRDLDSVIVALESQPGTKRIVGAMNVVFTRMAQEFYDRNQDFFPYKPTNKDLSMGDSKEFGLENMPSGPSEQVYLFPRGDSWYAEIIDHNDWNLKELEGNNVIQLPYNSDIAPETVVELVKEQLPGAYVDYFNSHQEWLKEVMTAAPQLPVE